MKKLVQHAAACITLPLLMLLSPLSFAQGESVISSSDVQRLRAFIGDSDLGTAHDGSSGSATRAQSSGSGVVNGVYIVKPGDTLSEIMSKHLGDTGFNEQVLQQVIVSSNKRAFRRGNPHWLMAGASLKMPTAIDVMEYIAPGSAGSKRMASANDWVRFP